jgi:hypothetical protein
MALQIKEHPTYLHYLEKANIASIIKNIPKSEKRAKSPTTPTIINLVLKIIYIE